MDRSHRRLIEATRRLRHCGAVAVWGYAITMFTVTSFTVLGVVMVAVGSAGGALVVARVGHSVRYEALADSAVLLRNTLLVVGVVAGAIPMLVSTSGVLAGLGAAAVAVSMWLAHQGGIEALEARRWLNLRSEVPV